MGFRQLCLYKPVYTDTLYKIKDITHKSIKFYYHRNMYVYNGHTINASYNTLCLDSWSYIIHE
jgi:hypothetical protein